MHRDRVLDAPLERVRQRRIRGARARELGGAALEWNDARREQRAERGHRLERRVAVPEHVRELINHAPVVGRDDRAGLDIEVRLARERRACRRIDALRDLQRAEAPAECDLRVVVEPGAAEDQHRVLLEGGANLQPRGVVHRVPDVVDAVNLRREDGSQRRHPDGHGPLYYRREVTTMRKTITGTGGMLLLQTLKDAGVDYLFTNPGSAETGIFAALAESEEQRLVVGKHEGLVAAMADGYHRLSGKVGIVIAHVMGGSWQLAGQLFNAQHAGSALLVVAGDWASELQDFP